MNNFDPRPIPDPRKPISRDELSQLKEIGIPGPSVATFASKEHWIEATGVGAPENGPSKYWRDNDAIETQSAGTGGVKSDFERYYAFLELNADGSPRSINIHDQSPGEGMSHFVTWGVLGFNAANFAKTQGPESVPRLMIFKLGGPEAARLSFAPGIPLQYPLCDLVEDDTGGLEWDGKRLMTRWPADQTLRFGANGCPEVFNIHHPPAAVTVTTQTSPSLPVTSSAPVPTTSARSTTTKAKQPTPIAPTPAIDGIQEIRGMGYNTATGEAIRYIIYPDHRKEEPTGWTFLTVAQLQPLPVPGVPLGTFQQVVGVEPWGFASLETCDKLAALFHNVLMRDGLGDWKLSITMGDHNEAFPYSTEQRYITFQSGSGLTERRNAGLIASECARNPVDPEVIIREQIASVKEAFDRTDKS